MSLTVDHKSKEAKVLGNKSSQEWKCSEAKIPVTYWNVASGRFWMLWTGEV